jgi:hypothetical protein
MKRAGELMSPGRISTICAPLLSPLPSGQTPAEEA